MTYKEAKEALLNTHIQFGRSNGKTLFNDSLNVALKAINKQIPQKPIYWNNEMYICPNCHRAEYIKQRDGLDVYCGGCGQLIDWSE